MILLSMSVLLTWVYLETGSVLLGLMHSAFNGTVPLTWGLDPSWVWQARALVLTAVAHRLSQRVSGFQGVEGAIKEGQ
jgi:hypothetical protein